MQKTVKVGIGKIKKEPIQTYSCGYTVEASIVEKGRGVNDSRGGYFHELSNSDSLSFNKGIHCTNIRTELVFENSRVYFTE